MRKIVSVKCEAVCEDCGCEVFYMTRVFTGPTGLQEHALCSDCVADREHTNPDPSVRYVPLWFED